MLRLTNIRDWKYFKTLEAAISIDDILDSNDLIIVRDLKKKEIKLVLYDIKKDEILGYITAFRSDKGMWQIDRSATNKGYGPFMYDSLMMEINPESIQPSYLIKPQALNIWNYYFNNRKDVNKKEIDPNSINYADFYKEDDSMESPKLKNKDNLKLINTLYSKKITGDYVHFINESEAIIKRNNINKNKILKKALDYFHSKYWTLQDSYKIKESIDNKEDFYLIRKDNEFCLTTKNKILAYADLSFDGNHYTFDKIYGPGYGILMHRLVLMSVYPKFVRPSASSKPKVIDIWKKLKNESEYIESSNKLTYYDDFYNKKQTKDLDIINNMYRIKPDNDYINLLEKSKIFTEKMSDVVKDYVTKRLKIARELFLSSYLR